MTSLNNVSTSEPRLFGKRWTAPGGLFLVFLLLVVPLFAKSFVVFQMTLLLTYAIAILSLNVLTGITGQFSFGQGAFYAAGAYVTAILLGDYELPFSFALPVSGIVCFCFGFLFGLPALRLSGTYLALATFSLAAATPQILKLHFIEAWTGGVQGKVVIPPEPPLGLAITVDVWLYVITVVVAVATYVYTANLLNSPTGRAFKAIRDNEVAAYAMGVNVPLYKTMAFGISAAITGIAGSLSAIVVQYVAPDSFSITLSIGIFLGMVIGGVGWLPGSIAGAAFILFVPNVADDFAKGLSGLIYGVSIFFVIFLLPRGAQQIVLSLRRVTMSAWRRGQG